MCRVVPERLSHIQRSILTWLGDVVIKRGIPLRRFFKTIAEELPKTLLQALFAFLIAWGGAELGFWGQIRGENYRQRVEAIASLAGTGAEVSQLTTSYYSALIYARRSSEAGNRFNCQHCIEDLRSWHLRADEILREIARAKGEFHKSLSRVRILFLNNTQINSLLEKVSTTGAPLPPDETAKASNSNELEIITKKSIETAIQNVNETMMKRVEEVVRTLEVELAKHGHGKN
jgi:hypothetical protein